jgi:Tfp pilus assembly protein PilO
MTTARIRRRLDLREDFWRLAAVLGVLLAINVGFYALVSLPRVRALQALEGTGDAAARALRTTAERRDAMLELIRRYDEERVRLADFYENMLGSQADRMTAVQKEIRGIAGEFRIDPEAIDYTTTAIDGTDLIRFQVTIPLVGGYPNLRQFINRVERSPHLLVVDEVQLTGSREGGAMLSLTIKISTCFRSAARPPAAATPAPA